VPTQIERSSATREKTIAATIHCLVEHGYAGATIAAVAARAGISRGAVSHQYPDKHSLVIDVVDEIGRRRTNEARAVLESVPAGRPRIEAGLDELWRAFKDPIYVAALEVYVGGRTEPALHPRVLRLEADIDEAIRAVIRAMIGPTDQPVQLDVRADVVINTMRGLALMYATGAPREPLERAWERARADAVESLSQLIARPSAVQDREPVLRQPTYPTTGPTTQGTCESE
jgi:AcrR family transcriptional regulator